MSNRDNFSARTKSRLALRVRYICSKPSCRISTMGPSLESEDAVVNVGVAAHIQAAAVGGPRYMASMTPEERAAIGNGIWLCQVHAKEIDSDVVKYPASLLHEWKDEHEAAMGESVGYAVDGLRGFDAEVESATSLYRERKIEAGMDRLQQLRNRDWDKLSPRQRYRTLANLGNGHLYSGQQHRAAALFTEAAYYQPDDHDAQAFLARAFELQGNRAAALELAEELVSRACKRAVSIFIRCSDVTTKTEALVQQTSLWHQDLEILVALTVRAVNEPALVLAETLSAQLDSEFPKRPEGPLLQAKTIYARHTMGMKVSAIDPAPVHDPEEIARADRLLTEALARARHASEDGIAADVLLTRYHMRSLAGREAEAAADLEEASRLAPKEKDVLFSKAIHLRPHNKEGAIQLLRDAISAGDETRARFLLAMCLAEGEAGQLEALELFSHLAANEDSEVQQDAIGLGVNLASRTGNREVVAEFLTAASDIDETLHATLLGEEALSKGDVREAEIQAAHALGAVIPRKTVASTRRGLAALQNKLGLQTQSITLWSSLVAPGFESPDLWQLMLASIKVGQHDIILQRCSELRAAGRWVPRYVNLEISVLGDYDSESAWQVATEYLKRFPEDRLATLRWCYLCLRTDRESDATVALESLPEATGTLEMATATAQLLRQCARYEEALAYSYELLRAHWGEADAHYAYFCLHLQIEPHLRPTAPETVEPGAAVCFREVGSKADKWIVIEDAPSIYPMLGEVRADSPRGKRFLGAAVGERVQVSEGVSPREVDIVNVAHKYGHRWRHCADEYEMSFPNRQDLQSFEIGDESLPFEERFAPMLQIADNSAKRMSDVLAAYATSPLSQHALSELLSIDEISCGLKLAGDEATVVRAGMNDVAATYRSMQRARSQTELVLAPSAFATILALGVGDQVVAWGWKLLIGSGTRDVVTAFIKDRRDPRESGMFGKTEEGYTFDAIDPEQAARVADDTQALFDACEVTAAMGLAKLPSSSRERVVGLYGQAGAESLAIAEERQTLVWTDDYTYLAVSAGGVANTQAVILSAVMREVLSMDDADEHICRLLGYRYEPTRFTPSTIKVAARLAAYDPGVSPFSRIVELLAEDGRVPEQVIATAVNCIFEVASNLDLEISRSARIAAVLERLAERENGLLLMVEVGKALPEKFGLNILRGLEAQQTVTSWMAVRGIAEPGIVGEIEGDRGESVK